MIIKYSGTNKIAEVAGGGMTFDDIYPVGSIYISADGTKPKLGVWEEFASGRTLLGESSSHTVGSTGGEEKHTLTVAEMPSHTHNSSRNLMQDYGVQALRGWNVGNTANAQYVGGGAWTSNATGGGQAHNNMPPYITVTFFRRTA